MKKTLSLKKVLALILAIVMIVSLVACGGNKNADNDTGNNEPSQGETNNGADTEVKYKERVVIANASLLAKLDPQSNNTSVNQHIYELTHNTLVGCDYSTGELVPELATSWELDGLTYTFHLRDDVTFYEGQKFTAEDVKFTYERAATTSSQKPKVKDIESIEVVDDYTLKITLANPNAEFLDLMCSPNMSILCSQTVGEFNSDAATTDESAKNGTGAYYLTEWVPGDYALVTRNDNYWGELPVTKEIKYVKYGEASARVIALQTGEVDICLDVPAIEVPHIEEADNCELLKIPSTKLVYIGLNVNGVNKALTDPKVRLALNYATNTEDIILAQTEGNANPAHGCIPQTQWGYSDTVKTPSYDIEKAKSLLADAGYANGLDITLYYDGSVYPGLYEILQAQWAAIGVNLILGTDDKTILDDHTSTGTHEATVAQASFSVLDGGLRNLWYSGSGSNRTMMADPVLDAMLDDAVKEMDAAKRLPMYEAISQYLTDTGAQIPLYVDTLLYGVNSNADGYVFYACGRHDFKNVAVIE